MARASPDGLVDRQRRVRDLLVRAARRARVLAATVVRALVCGARAAPEVVAGVPRSCLTRSMVLIGCGSPVGCIAALWRVGTGAAVNRAAVPRAAALARGGGVVSAFSRNTACWPGRSFG
jgi:hypothetical protein